tara:strand:+ start:15466 stop:17184 length:1719 start_codon:yes stop_codon:yes gene_type:complete
MRKTLNSGLRNIKIFFGNYYYRFYLLVFILIINGILEGLSLASIPLLLSSLFAENGNSLFSKFSFLEINIPDINPVFLFSFIVISIFLIKNLFLLFALYFENITYLKIKKKVSSRIFYKLLKQDFIFQIKSNSAKSIRIIDRDLDQAIEYFRFIILYLREIFTLIAILVFLILGSSLFGVSTFFLLGIISYFFLKIVKDRISITAKQVLELKLKVIQKIQNVLKGIKEIKIFSLEQKVFNNFVIDYYTAEKKKVINDIIFRLPKIILEVLGIIFLVLSILVLSLNLELQEILPIITLLGISIVRLVPCYGSLTSTLSKIKGVIPGFKSIMSELNDQNLTKNFKFDSDNNVNYKTDFSEVTLQNLDFGYNRDSKILKNINLRLIKNKSYFIKGESGKGKSTLCYIILGLLPPNKGNILIDNKIYKTEEIKSLFSYVPQESLILNDSIKNNIIFDQKIEDKKYFDQIIKLIGIDEIPNFQNDIEIGDGGGILSGGQKQRIAIARSLIRKPKILILDESFNALHEEAEKSLIKNIKQMCPNITLIIISHRSSSMRDCDEIIDFKSDGSVEARDIV